MVAQLTLDQLVKVRILVPQWFDSLTTSESNHPEQTNKVMSLSKDEVSASRDEDVVRLYFRVPK